MSAENKNTTLAEGAEHGQDMTKGRIWKVFFYLLGLTAIEFIVALGFVHTGILEKGPFVIAIYIVLTLVKAYYIIAYFMHLKFEKPSFIILVAVSMLLLIYFIILLYVEGFYLKHHLFE